MKNSSQDQPRYTRALAAQLADISIDFLERCESERLIEIRVMQTDEQKYSARDIRRLALIGRLHDVLGINLGDLEVVLHLRTQLLDMQEQMQDLERQWIAREEKLLKEMLDLRRRIAEDADWE
jgi:DNA-binding transcriptional MerR regulator